MAGMPFPGEDSSLSETEQAYAIYLMLRQTETWIDGVGRAHLIDNMAVRYKANVIAFLHRRASHLVKMYAAGAVAAIESDAHGPAEVALIEETDVANPHAWLSRTPLMMRLMVDVAQGVGGRTD